MFKYLVKVWGEITQDKTGHTVAIDLYKAVSFWCGIVYFMVLLPVVYVYTGVILHSALLLPDSPGFFLVGLAFGLQTLKVASRFLDRKTADDAGNALATPDSIVPPTQDVELMPQASAKAVE